MDGAVGILWGWSIRGNFEPTAAPTEECLHSLLETGNKYQRSILGIK